jgi:hypothetical protein
MNKKLIPIALFPFLVACAEAEPTSDEPSEAAPAVSGAALSIEQAERMLDRGEDAGEAKRLIEAVIASGSLTADQQSTASVALSRAHEALGETEPAIAVLEKALAGETDPHHPASLAVRDRLRALVTGSPDKPGPSFVPNDPAPEFARALSSYFRPNAEGQISARLFLVGGDDGVSEALGTFNVGAGRRAELDAECPLCDHKVNVHTSRSQGDWMLIPSNATQFANAFVAFYYDLQKNRIPARYEAFLPMTVQSIEAELNAGHSLIAATERPGAPPVVLLAAPRTAMLEDVEKALSGMSELPVEPQTIEVETKLRPKEIQAVVRGDFFKPARRCYEELSKRQPEARGKLNLWFEIDGEGTVADHRVTVIEGTLDEAAFERCIDEAVAKLRFPAIGASTTVNYPVTMTP